MVVRGAGGGVRARRKGSVQTELRRATKVKHTVSITNRVAMSRRTGAPG